MPKSKHGCNMPVNMNIDRLLFDNFEKFFLAWIHIFGQ